MEELTLKQVRKKLRLTQEEMAEGTGYNQGHISDMEGGKANITEDFLAELETAYELSKKGIKVIVPVDNYGKNQNYGSLSAAKKNGSSTEINGDYSAQAIRDLARSNVTMAENHKILAQNEARLIALLEGKFIPGTAVQEPQIPETLLTVLAKLGIGKLWKTEAEGIKELRKPFEKKNPN